MRRDRNFAAGLPWYILACMALCLFIVSSSRSLGDSSGSTSASGPNSPPVWIDTGSSSSGDSNNSWGDNSSSDSWWDDSDSSDSSGWDFGESDSGSWDSGGSDSGSWDFGGSDSGGWDSGGSDSGSW